MNRHSLYKSSRTVRVIKWSLLNMTGPIGRMEGIGNLHDFVQEQQGRRICVISDVAGIQTVYVLVCTSCKYKYKAM